MTSVTVKLNDASNIAAGGTRNGVSLSTARPVDILRDTVTMSKLAVQQRFTKAMKAAPCILCIDDVSGRTGTLANSLHLLHLHYELLLLLYDQQLQNPDVHVHGMCESHSSV